MVIFFLSIYFWKCRNLKHFVSENHVLWCDHILILNQQIPEKTLISLRTPLIYLYYYYWFYDLFVFNIFIISLIISYLLNS